MIQLRTVLDNRKPKADGTYPIYYRITEKKKVSYLYTGFSIQKSYWDEQKNSIKKTHPNASVINTSLTKRYLDIQKIIIQLEDEGVFSLLNLKEKLLPKTENISVKEFADKLIREMFGRNETGNAVVYQTCINSLFRYSTTKGLKFIDITTDFIEQYQIYLFRKGCKTNTVSNYIRTLKAIYNKTLKSKIVDRKYYPFYDLAIKTEATPKRAFSKDVLKQIEVLPLPNNSAYSLARDYYMLSFYLIGINFTDLAYLKKGNICNGRIEFKRRKTGKWYNIKLHSKANDLLNTQTTNECYLLPILHEGIVEDSLKAKMLIQQWIKTTNKYLGRISEQLKLEKRCTTYTVRHSWATIAKKPGYSKELISEALGHQQGNRITEIYLDKFDSEVIDEVNLKVIE